MATPVNMNVMCRCAMGDAPLPIAVSQQTVTTGNLPIATITDNKFPPFGMCKNPSNPAVIAAGGSPVPCTPLLVAPWAPGSPTVLIGGLPVLNDSSQLLCAIAPGGVISVVKATAVTVAVP